MPEREVTCAVCHRLRTRTRGSFSDARDVFICAECQAAANQLIEIEDRIWPTPPISPTKGDEIDQPENR